MAFCAKCGTKLANSAKFCPSCGTSAEGTVSESKASEKKESVFDKLPAAEAKEKLNAGKEKVNAGINKLPFKKLAEEKIPAGARAKFPILNSVIPFANQIVCGLAILLLVIIIASAGDDNSPKGLAKQTYKLEQKALKLREDSPKVMSLAQEAAKIMEKVGKLSIDDGLIYLQEVGRLRTGISVSKSNKKEPKTSKASSGSSAVSFAKSDNAESDFEVTLTRDNAGVVISKYVGTAAQVRIPAAIQGMPVREIGDYAFTDRGGIITSVFILEGVTKIGRRAFDTPDNFTASKLALVSLPEGLLEICDSAFENTALTEITLPQSLINIGYQAFYGSKIKTITIPNGLKPYYTGFGDRIWENRSDKKVFSNCKNLETVTISEGIPDIPDGMFYDCTSLTTVVLPASIKKIGYDAFRRCENLTTITIPDSVEKIAFVSNESIIDTGSGEFSGCSKIPLATQAALRGLGYKGAF